MLRIFIMIVFMGISSTAFSGEKIDHPAASKGRFTVDIFGGVAKGVANELVYSGSHKLSELIWDFKDAPMIGISLQAVLVRSVDLTLHAKAASIVQKSTAVMDDYDWFVVGGDWTHWSHHNNTTLEKGMYGDVSLSINLAKARNSHLKLDGFVGYRKDNWKWTAVGGTFIYTSNPGVTFRDQTGIFANVPGISYEQTTDAPYAGVSLIFQEDNFSLNTKLFLSPKVKATAVDHHFLRDLIFTDSFTSGRMLGVDLNYAYHINERIKVALLYSYLKYKMSRGDTHSVNTVTNAVGVFPDSAGMKLGYQQLSLSASITF